jgi:hypothetical protein
VKAGEYIFSKKDGGMLKPTMTLKNSFPDKDGDEEWGSWKGAFFGVYVGHGGQAGTLKVGDKIEVQVETTWDAHKTPLKDFFNDHKVAIAAGFTTTIDPVSQHHCYYRIASQ